jgi:hypothetical protein
MFAKVIVPFCATGSVTGIAATGTVVVVVGGTVVVGADTVTPLFQTNFFPLATQVYFLTPTVTVLPFGEQVVPAFGAVAEDATDNGAPKRIRDAAAVKATTCFFIDCL